MVQRVSYYAFEDVGGGSIYNAPLRRADRSEKHDGILTVSRNLVLDDFGSSIGAADGMPPFSYVLSKYGSTDLRQCARYLTLPRGWHFFAAKDLPFAMAQIGEAYVLLAGIAIDVESAVADLTSLASDLLGILRNSREAFYEATDRLAGRWVVFYSDGRNSAPIAMGDATHSIKVNYTEDASVCSSNIFLISRLLGQDKPEYRPQFLERRKLWLRGVLGNLQPTLGVKALTPNHEIELDTGEMTRFFPRSEPEVNDVESVIDDVIRLSQNQIKALSERYVLFNSLTAGIDSRFSLALASDDCENQYFFTYMFEEQHRIDVLVGNALADQLGLSHYAIIGKNSNPHGVRERIRTSEIIEFEENPRLLAEIRKWDWYGSLPQATISYVQMLDRWRRSASSTKQPLHIRSNLYEIGRAFWGARAGRCNETSEILPKSRRDWDKNARGSFSRYFAEAKLDPDSCKGYDLLDMFYWEHRCGTWVNEVLQGTDFAFNTVSYVNCRSIIKKLISVDFAERTSAAVFNKIIARKLPKVEGIPINPAEF